jgi:hypothetical protein
MGCCIAAGCNACSAAAGRSYFRTAVIRFETAWALKRRVNKKEGHPSKEKSVEEVTTINRL